MLENAIEAAKQTKEKYLDVNIAIKRGVLKIQVENSFLPSNIVEDHNGTMEVLQQDDKFPINLILYMSQTENKI